MAAPPTPAEVYARFAECHPPENYHEFGAFGSLECLPPIGPTKPEGAVDLAPYQAQQQQPVEERPARTPRRQPQPEAHAPGRRGGRGKQAPPPPKKPFKPFAVPQPPGAPVIAWGRSGAEPLTVPPPGQSPASGWGQPIPKPKVASFAELLESEAKAAPRRRPG